MIEKYHDPILTYLTENGAAGVNAIASGTGIALSTVQKYLTTQQNYFQKTSDRKWDLPTNVAVETKTNILITNVELLKSAISMIQAQLEETTVSLTNLMPPISFLERSLNNAKLPVADNSVKVPKEFEKILEQLTLIKGIFKKNKEAVGDYYDLLISVNWNKMVSELGSIYFRDEISAPLSDLILHQTELDKNLIDVLKQYIPQENETDEEDI